MDCKVALSRPYTFIVFALVIVLMTPLVLERTPTDIFPEINIPVISVAWNYSGFSPEQMEDYIVSNYERYYDHRRRQHRAHRVANRRRPFGHQGVFPARGGHSHGHVQLTASRRASFANCRRASPRRSSSPIRPRPCRSWSWALKGQGLSEQELFDYGANFVRNQMSTVPGAAIPWPYGGKQREVSVNVDIPALQAKGLSPVDVINAISSQNLALPAGTVKIGPTEYNVQMNGSTDTIAALNDLADQDGERRDDLRARRRSRERWLLAADQHRAHGRAARRAGDDLQDRQRLDARHRQARSTPSCRRLPPRLPPQLVITPLFDQSIFVRAAVQGRDPRRIDRRLPDRADDSAVPRQLAQHADHRYFHSAFGSWFRSWC